MFEPPGHTWAGSFPSAAAALRLPVIFTSSSSNLNTRLKDGSLASLLLCESPPFCGGDVGYVCGGRGL